MLVYSVPERSRTLGVSADCCSLHVLTSWHSVSCWRNCWRKLERAKLHDMAAEAEPSMQSVVCGMCDGYSYIVKDPDTLQEELVRLYVWLLSASVQAHSGCPQAVPVHPNLRMQCQGLCGLGNDALT